MRIGVEIDSSNYTFNALAKTITFIGITGLSLESFSLITNVEQGDNVVIYQFQKLGKGATFAANVLTLEYNTAAMSNGDALKINASVNYSQVTQPVTITNPTETGLNKEVTQLLVKSNTDKLDVPLSTLLKSADTLNKVLTVDTITNVVHVDDNGGSLTVDGTVAVSNFPVSFEISNDTGNPIPISASSLPLPTGASTEATLIQVRDYLDTVETKLASLITNSTGLSLEATQIQVRDYLDTVETKLQTIITNLGSPFQAGGSIGNTAFIANAGTNLNTSALNLEATQQLLLTALNDIKTYTDGIETLIGTSNTKLTSIDGKDFATQTTLALIKAKTDNLDVALSTRLNTLGQKTSANSTPVVIASDQSAIPISGNVTSTPSGTQDVNLTKVGGTAISIGQQLAAASLPVILPAATISTLTPPASITGFNLEATQLLVKAKTDNLDVLLSTRLKPSDTLTKVTTVDTITNPVAVTGAFFQATQPISGTVTVSNPTTNPETGLSTSSKQDLLLAELQLKADLTETQPVSAAIPAIAIAKKSVVATASGDTTIHTPVSGKKIRLFSFGYSASGTVDTGNIQVRWKFGAGLYQDTQFLTGNQAYSKSPGNGKFCYEGAIDEALVLNLDTTATIAMNIDYEEI